MDKHLLDALSNLSESLEQIAIALSSKNQSTTATTQALKSGNFVEQINQINIGVKNLQKDTKQILSNQQTILSLSKQKGGTKDDLAEKIGGDKNKQKFVKDGLGVILLMAVAILSLGVAFKVIGSVNFFSVIAISGAIVILSIAFANVHTTLKKVGFTAKDGINFILAVVAISTGISLSSWILSTVKPIGLAQFFTTLFIAGGFAILAPNISKFFDAFKGIGMSTIVKSIVFLPLILPAIALGIAMSSWALQLVKPIGLAQFFTTIFIAGAFSIIAFGITKMISAFRSLSPADLVKASIGLPLILPAISLAIAASSWALQLVKPIGLAQFFTTIFIAGIFLALSYSLVPLTAVMKRLSVKDVLLIPFVFVTLSMAIYVSSLVISSINPIPYSTLFNILIMSGVLAASAFVLSFPIKILANIGIKNVVMGSLSIIVIAGAIMASSMILNMGVYKNFPTIGWAIGVGASMLGFIPAVLTLGFISMTGIGALAILFGSGMTLLVAGTIASTSLILNRGKYGYGKDMLPWALSVSLLYLTFTPIMIALGALGLIGSLLSFFGVDPFAKAKDMMIQIAETIVGVSRVLSRGRYVGGPTKDWSEGVSLAIGAFSPVYAMLLRSKFFSIFGESGVSPDDFSKAIGVVSKGIINAGDIFARSPGVWKNGPPKKWAEGVGLAIGAFAPVYAIISQQSILDALFSSKVTPENMKSAMLTISDGIVEVAKYFNNSTVDFKGNYPSKKWGEGVGSSIKTFADVMALGDDWDWDEEEFNMLNYFVRQIAVNVLDVAAIFAGQEYKDPLTGKTVKPSTPSFNKYPKSEWVDGITNSIQGMVDIINYLYNEVDIDGDDLDSYNSSLRHIARGIRDISFSLSKGDYSKIIPANWMKNVSSTIMQYVKLTRYLTTMGGDSGLGISGLMNGLLGSKSQMDPIDRSVLGIVKLSKAYTVLADSLGKFGSAIKSMDVEKINLFRSITGNLAILSTLDSEMFNKMIDTLEERAGVFTDLLNQYDKDQSKRSSATPNVTRTGVKTGKSQKSDTQVLGEKLDRIAASLSDIQSVVGGSGTLKSYIDSLGKEATIGGNKSIDYR